MKKFDVVLCPTSRSLTHTDARRAASAAGVRIATLPGVNEEIMVRCMNADYHAIAKRTFAICALMEKTTTIRVTSAAGTDITMPITGRKAHASSGILRERGQWGNLPTGEAYLAPVEGASECRGGGRIDGADRYGETPIRIEVKGYAGRHRREEAKSWLAIEPFGRDAHRRGVRHRHKRPGDPDREDHRG